MVVVVVVVEVVVVVVVVVDVVVGKHGTAWTSPTDVPGADGCGQPQLVQLVDWNTQNDPFQHHMHSPVHWPIGGRVVGGWVVGESGAKHRVKAVWAQTVPGRDGSTHRHPGEPRVQLYDVRIQPVMLSVHSHWHIPPHGGGVGGGGGATHGVVVSIHGFGPAGMNDGYGHGQTDAHPGITSRQPTIGAYRHVHGVEQLGGRVVVVVVVVVGGLVVVVPPTGQFGGGPWSAGTPRPQ